VDEVGKAALELLVVRQNAGEDKVFL
jgi:hypothetical protein